jgi:hypothetical protein
MATCSGCEGDCMKTCTGSCMNNCAGSCITYCGNNCQNNCNINCEVTCGHSCDNKCGNLSSQNSRYSDTNLLSVLGASSVSAAMGMLHTRCINGDFSDLALGMYLKINDFSIDGTLYNYEDDGVTLVIAGFNTYKDLNGYNNDNHILFLFKETTLLFSNTSYSRIESLLEGAFKSALIRSIGDGYIYPVYRYCRTEYPYNDNMGLIKYSVWIPSPYEAIGYTNNNNDHMSSDEVNLSRLILLYNNYPEYRKIYEPVAEYHCLNKGYWSLNKNGDISTDHSSYNNIFGFKPFFCIH